MGIAVDSSDGADRPLSVPSAVPDAHAGVDDRDRFLASLAHQIRTPLTAVVAILELLSAESVEPEEAVELFGHAKQQAANLGVLVDRFLLAGRVTTGTLTLRSGPVELDEVVASVLDRLDVPSGMAVEVGQLGVVTADRDRVRDVIESILENAVRFADSTVLVAYDSGASELIIANDGPPVPASIEHELFDFFSSSGRAGLDGALGLGLAMGREIMRAMGGDLSHRRRGVTTEFVLTFGGSAALALEAETAAPGVVVEPIADLVRGATAGYVVPRHAVESSRTAIDRLMESIPINRVLVVPIELVESGIRSGWRPPVGLVVLADHDRLAGDPELADLVDDSDVALAVDGLGAATTDSVVALRPTFLVTAVPARGALAAELRSVGRLAAASDAFVICTGFERAEDLEQAVAIGVPLATGPLIGAGDSTAWPDVSEQARRVLAAPSPRQRESLRVSGLFGPVATRAIDDPSTGGFEVVVDADRRPVAVLVDGDLHAPFTAHVSESAASVLQRAIGRAERSRFTPVIAIDSASRPLGMVTIETLIDAVTDER